MNSASIFDILGICSRKGSYTNLLDYAFKNSDVFRKGLLFQLGRNNFSGWHSKTDLSIKWDPYRKKVQLDWVLYNTLNKQIIVVENKIFSTKDFQNYTYYKERLFHTNLCNLLNIKDGRFKFYALTLDAKSSRVNMLRPLSLKKLVECMPDEWAEAKVGLLMKEFKHTIQNHKSEAAHVTEEDLENLRPQQGIFQQDQLSFPLLTNAPELPEDQAEARTTPKVKKTKYPAQWYMDTWKEVVQKGKYDAGGRRRSW